LRATMRRIPGATGSSRPYSNENSRGNGISAALTKRLHEITRPPQGFAGYRSPRREVDSDEDQARYRLHAGGGKAVFRTAGGEAATGGAAQRGSGPAAGEPQGDGPRGDAEDLAADDLERVRAAARNVLCADGRHRQHEEIAVPGALWTPRLLLRPWRDEDIAAFLEMSADPVVMEYLPPADEAWVVRTRAHWDEHGFGQWVVEIPGGAAFIGVVGLSTISFEAPFTPAVAFHLRLAWP